MLGLPPTPNGSIIQTQSQDGGTTICWFLPTSWTLRLVTAAGMSLFAIGPAIAIIIQKNEVESEKFLLALVCPFVLLSTLIWPLWMLLRPDRPESLTLGNERFRYCPGRTVVPVPFWLMRSSEETNVYCAIRDAATICRPIEVDRSAVRQFVLEWVGTRQRLRFDRGADRIEIGASLREPEREWLHGILEEWRRGADGAS